jgi:sodium/potassium-transporting ATPase subunit alpha
MTYYQNSKSDAIMEAFKNFIPPKCTVLRNGKWSTTDATKLVPGDIVEIKAGNRIPADLRIVFSQEMKVDNSSLTGESDALLRKVECSHPENPLETDNLAFFGTLCKEGMGRGVVIYIGDSTVIGQIANLASTAGNETTPLRREMDRFIVYIAIIAFSLGIFFFAAGFIIGYNAITNVVFAIGIIVANVPEGLYACITVSLTLAAKRLSVRKVLVKNLEAVETLGSTTCICSDKTGTLTQNRMTVEKVWYDGEIKKAHNKQKHKEELHYDIDSIGFRTLHDNAILCSDATFNNAVPYEKIEILKQIHNEQEREKKRQEIENEHAKELENMYWLDRPTIGDASESALIKFFQPISDILDHRNKHPIRQMKDSSIAKIPFNSSWKYALTICDYQGEDSNNCIFIKGAPEKIWSLSSFVSVNGKAVPKDKSWEENFAKANRIFGEGGERVLGFARLPLNKEQYPSDYQFNCKSPTENNYPMKNFIFSGLISLVDPPRDAVPYAILKCKTAHIKVIMVTGDQPVTAAAIARQVNIFSSNEKTVNQIMEEENISFNEAFDKANALVIHGDKITQATIEDELLPEAERGKPILKWLEKPRIVFARTTPAQKLIIVKACQQQGHIVAVTGDGVNDSPAIKKADIGIAMGITGSDVAKDAADMILLSDDFAAIVIGIEEGRRVFDNLKKSMVYVFTSNIPELIPFLTLIILRFPLPLSTVLILCIDLGTDIIPSIGFGSEEAEVDIMVRAPRKKHDHLVTARVLTASYVLLGVIQTMGGFLTYFTIMYDFGITADDLVGLAVDYTFKPGDNDVFDRNAPYMGHTNPSFMDYCNNCWNNNGECDVQQLSGGYSDPPDWLYTNDLTSDLRLWYLQCNADGTIGPIFKTYSCNVKQISTVSGLPICFTTEMLKFAQTGFFFSVVLSQYTNAINTKTRKTSFMYGGFRNFSLWFGFGTETMLTFLLAYQTNLNQGLGTRPLILLHYGFPSVPFVFIMLVYDEVRKYLIRSRKGKDGKPNWWIRNAEW